MALPARQDSSVVSHKEEISIHLASPTPNNGDNLYFVFPVGLEGITVAYGTRASITQALDAFWVDSLGPSIVQFTISGHTGYLAGKYGGGRQAMIRMLKIHKEHQQRLKDHPNGQDSLLFFLDETSKFRCWCVATNLQVTRDHNSATLFHFEWQFTVVADLSDYMDKPRATTLPGLPNTGGGGRYRR